MALRAFRRSTNRRACATTRCPLIRDVTARVSRAQGLGKAARCNSPAKKHPGAGSVSLAGRTFAARRAQGSRRPDGIVDHGGDNREQRQSDGDAALRQEILAVVQPGKSQLRNEQDLERHKPSNSSSNGTIGQRQCGIKVRCAASAVRPFGYEDHRQSGVCVPHHLPLT